MRACPCGWRWLSMNPRESATFSGSCSKVGALARISDHVGQKLVPSSGGPLDLFDRGKRSLDFPPLGFQEARQLERAPEAFHRFVHREAWLISCDLEQDSTRFTE